MLWGSVSGPDVVLVVLAGPEVHSAPLSACPPFLSKEFASTYRKQKAKKNNIMLPSASPCLSGELSNASHQSRVLCKALRRGNWKVPW